MPTFKHGKTAYVAFGSFGAGTTPVSYGNVINTATLTRPVDTAETSAFGTTGKTFVTGLYGGTFSISGMMDPTVDAILAGLIGQDIAIAMEYGPGGNTAASAQPKFTLAGNLAANAFTAPGLILTNYQITAPIGGMVGFQADFQISGAVTRATY